MLRMSLLLDFLSCNEINKLKGQIPIDTVAVKRLADGYKVTLRLSSGLLSWSRAIVIWYILQNSYQKFE